SCSFELTHDLPSLKTLKFTGDPELRGFDNKLSAQNLTTLELLNTDDVIPLPPVLPALEHIILRGYSNLGTLARLSTPRLRALSCYSSTTKLDMLKQAGWAALKQLDFLGLYLDPHSYSWDAPEVLRTAAMHLRGVIQEAENVKHFYLKGPSVLRILLKPRSCYVASPLLQISTSFESLL
ncbi:439_t:CDS:2, partial [Acaulospora colombiana]